MNYKNIILNTDSYKASHWLQYPPGTEYVFSYIESRGGESDKTVFFGLQAAMIEYLEGSVFNQSDIDEAAEFFAEHGEPFNREGWEDMLRDYGGRLPIEIRAVPEGTVVPVGNILVSVVNTDPRFFWVTSYVETMLLRAVWYGTTVATISYNIKQLIKSYLEKTGDVNGLPFKLHDFGARGVSSFESAGIGDAAHLINFMGTDTITGPLFAKKYYNAKGCVGYSIPAAEHSTITSWGRPNEVEAYRNMLKQYAKPGSLLAVVSDSYNIYQAVENLWGRELKDEVIKSGATVVIRPDSGDPVSVVSDCLVMLDNAFGSVVNSKGYKVLNNVRVIQGDGIDEDMIRKILERITLLGYSADNVAYGMGGALLQHCNRDTQKFAMKCSAMRIFGEIHEVYKDPITDSGKRSKRGLLSLYRNADGILYTAQIDPNRKDQDELRTVFHAGTIITRYTFDEVRSNSQKG